MAEKDKQADTGVEGTPKCPHEGDKQPLGQSVMLHPTNGDLIVIMSAICDDCGDFIIRTHGLDIGVKPGPISMPNMIVPPMPKK